MFWNKAVLLIAYGFPLTVASSYASNWSWDSSVLFLYVDGILSAFLFNHQTYHFNLLYHQFFYAVFWWKQGPKQILNNPFL